MIRLCSGALASLGRGSVASGAQRVTAALSRGSQQAKQEALAHLDASLATALALGDAAGYKRSFFLQFKHLAEIGDEGRLREVYDSFTNGCHTSTCFPFLVALSQSLTLADRVAPGIALQW
eukprot:scaffold493295_cov33-Prasinocladus_malaysianus.AAC.1